MNPDRSASEGFGRSPGRASAAGDGLAPAKVASADAPMLGKDAGTEAGGHSAPAPLGTCSEGLSPCGPTSPRGSGRGGPFPPWPRNKTGIGVYVTPEIAEARRAAVQARVDVGMSFGEIAQDCRVHSSMVEGVARRFRIKSRVYEFRAAEKAALPQVTKGGKQSVGFLANVARAKQELFAGARGAADPRAKLPPVTADEAARLIARHIAEIGVTQCPAPAARESLDPVWRREFVDAGASNGGRVVRKR